MVAKYLIAGTLSAFLAGGAVWVAADTLDDHPLPEDSDKASVTQAEAGAATDPDRERAAPESESSRVIDRLLVKAPEPDSETLPESDVDIEPNEEIEAVSLPQEDSWGQPNDAAETESDTRTNVSSWDSEAASDMDKDMDEAVADEWLAADPSHSMAENVRDPETDMLDRRPVEDAPVEGAPVEESVETLVIESEAKGTSTFVIAPKADDDTAPVEMVIETPDEPLIDWAEDGGAVIEAPKDEMMTLSVRENEGPQSSAVYDILIEEAQKIEIIEARDDAYFNIIDFALMKGDFDQAKTLIGALSSEELRDTARQNSGIAFANAGRMEEAFAIIEELEIPALSDPIRAAIIRAATDTGG
jgi:hypothetical protein